MSQTKIEEKLKEMDVYCLQVQAQILKAKADIEAYQRELVTVGAIMAQLKELLKEDE